jgi:peptidyl-prolyl cis-trans isomerase B (cyclophilin B)
VGTTKRERQKANRQQRLEELARDARRRHARRRVVTWGGIVVAAIAAIYLIALLTGRDNSPTSTPSTDVSAPVATDPATTDPATDEPVEPGTFTYGTGACAPAEKPAEPVRSFAAAPQQCIDPSSTFSAVIETNKGSFTIALDNVNSPGTVNNFVTLARYGYYDDSTCHRIISGFVVQCGRPGDDEGAPGYTIPDEPVANDYAEAVVAMANTGAPDSGGGQWFVITGAQGAALPKSYTVLGTVSEGYETTVKALEALADPDAPNGVPTLEPITITSVTIVES